jgi:CHAT domain-containing protein/Tfp pilus assembly protein PilF
MALRLFLTAVLPLFLALSLCAAQQPSSKQPTEVIPIHPGQKLENHIANGQKSAHEFNLTKGQYVTANVECRGMVATIEEDGPAGNRIHQFDGTTDPTNRVVELVAEETGLYRITITDTSTNATVGTCTVEIAEPREATEKELWLQQARRLDGEAHNLYRVGKPAEARKPAEESLELREKASGQDAPVIADSCMVLSIIDIQLGDFANAEKNLQRGLKIKEASAATPPMELVPFLGNLGVVYNQTAEYDNAAASLQRVVDILEKTPGATDRYLALAIDNLAITYYSKGDYRRAQKLYERSLDLREKSLRPESSDIGDTLNNLANLHQAMGDFPAAEKLYLHAVEVFEKGDDKVRLGYALAGLAAAYNNEGEFEKSDATNQRSLEILQKSLGPDNPAVGNLYKNLGALKTSEGDLAKAQQYYLQALAILQKKLGDNHPDVAETLDGLGLVYSRQGDYSKAEPLLQNALAIRQKALGPEHPDVVTTLLHLSALQSGKGNFALAETYLANAITISEHNADLNLLTGSEREKLAYLDFLSEQLNQAITLNVDLAPEQLAARNLAATTVLQRKGRVLDVLSDSLVELRKHVNKEEVALLDEFVQITSQLSRLVLGGPQGTSVEVHQKQIAALQEKREKLESEISRRSAEYAVARKPVTLEAVRAALPANAALLEFVTYKKYPVPGKTEKQSDEESSHYAVYVIRSSGDIQSLDLGQGRVLDAAIDSYRQALRDPNRDDVKQSARTLNQKVMIPLRASIGDATHLLVSADGQLNLIPFESLVDDQNRFLIERYSVTYLTSGRDLLRMQVHRESKSEPLVIANPVFGEPEATLSARVDPAKLHQASPATARRSITTGENLSSVYFAPLGGTAEEARSIHSLFPQARILTGRQATKEALMVVEAPSILHIATHGFFLQDSPVHPQSDSANSRSNPPGAAAGNLKIENPLLRSGLALTGANLNRRGPDDGILTALEASGLNLWGTNLVTLSACETGVGEVRNGEGVYGLRRAFFLAGTESLVMSLWSVSDRATRDMMTSYYTGLKQGMGRGQALRQAKLAMLQRKDRQHPYYWASFIQSGEWATLDGKR